MGVVVVVVNWMRCCARRADRGPFPGEMWVLKEQLQVRERSGKRRRRTGILSVEQEQDLDLLDIIDIRQNLAIDRDSKLQSGGSSRRLSERVMEAFEPPPSLLFFLGLLEFRSYLCIGTAGPRIGGALCSAAMRPPRKSYFASKALTPLKVVTVRIAGCVGT